MERILRQEDFGCYGYSYDSGKGYGDGDNELFESRFTSGLWDGTGDGSGEGLSCDCYLKLGYRCCADNLFAYGSGTNHGSGAGFNFGNGSGYSWGFGNGDGSDYKYCDDNEEE